MATSPKKRRTLRSRFEKTISGSPRLRIIAATIGPGKAQLLEQIQQTGSISKAARAMGMSYVRAWQLVEALNAAFREPLVASDTGGTRGGGSHLTPTGERALTLYLRLRDHSLRAGHRDLQALHRLLRTE
ncbi:MAG: LysR family transcriptional regulator [Kiritimatiellae bacterium]|nr:LysR family transcriptional regulator [Kiritimatiellia bacterium]